MEKYNLDKVRQVCEFLGPTTPFATALMAEGYKRRGMLAPSQGDVVSVLSALEDPKASTTRVRLVALSINAKLVAEHPTTKGRDFLVILRQLERVLEGAGISRGPVWDVYMEMTEWVGGSLHARVETWRGEQLSENERVILRRVFATCEVAAPEF